MWWCVSTRCEIGLPGYFFFAASMTQRRLALVHRRIEDDDTLGHRHDQVVGGAADHVLDVGRQFDELETAAGRKVDGVAIQQAAEEQAADHPLVGQIGGRGSERHCSELFRNGEGFRRDRRVGGDLLVGEPLRLASAESEGQRMRKLCAIDRLPVAQNDVVIWNPHRCDRHRSFAPPPAACSCDRTGRRSASPLRDGDRRIGLLAKPLVLDRGHALRGVQRAQQEER